MYEPSKDGRFRPMTLDFQGGIPDKATWNRLHEAFARDKPGRVIVSAYPAEPEPLPDAEPEHVGEA